jgi:hypothetical protein
MLGSHLHLTEEDMNSERQFVVPVLRPDRWRLLAELIGKWHRPLLQGEGYDPQEISASEKRLGLKLPSALKEWYALAGRRQDVWNRQDKLVPPQEITVEAGVLVFYTENQAVTFWGVRLGELPKDDPPVVTRDEHADWRELCPEVSVFALQMFVYTLQFGARTRIYGWAEPASLSRIAALPELPLPPFLFPGGEFRFYGDQELIVTTDDAGHMSAVAMNVAVLARFRNLIAGSSFEILEELCEPRRVMSPDGHYMVEFGDDLGEIRMGSPWFGRIRIIELDPHKIERRWAFFRTKSRREIEFGERMFGETVLFSPDSRFVALEQLLEDHVLRTQLVVVELKQSKVFLPDAPPGERAIPARWEDNNRLIYFVTTHSWRREERIWHVPSFGDM